MITKEIKATSANSPAFFLSGNQQKMAEPVRLSREQN
jgi:hypothetical protein